MRVFRSDSGIGEALFWIVVAIITVAVQLLKSRKTPRSARRLPPVPIREPGSPTDELREFLEKLQREDTELKTADQGFSPVPPAPPPVPRPAPAEQRSLPSRRVKPTTASRPTVLSGLPAVEAPARTTKSAVLPARTLAVAPVRTHAIRPAGPRVERLRAVVRNRNSLQQAVILSELLGAPVGLRRFGFGAGFPPVYWA
ncbi:MAG: hypothetical protein ACUVWX_00185 [Kiritimatiellia bacterium]